MYRLFPPLDTPSAIGTRMTTQHPITATREKLFFTLSALTTSRTVRLALPRDVGAYEFELITRVWEGSPLPLCWIAVTSGDDSAT